MKRLFVMDHNSIEPAKQAIWIRLMQRFDIHVTVATPAVWPNPYGDAPLRAECNPDFDGTFLPIRVLMGNSIPRHVYAADLRRIISSARPDAIYGYHDWYMFASYQLFLSNLVSARVPIGFYASQNIAKSLPFPVSAAARHLLGRIDWLFPISKDAEAVARDRGFRGEAVSMPLFVDTDLFRPADRAALRARFGLGSEIFIVGLAGRLIEAKGLRVLLEAAARLDPSVHVVLTGKGPMEADLPGIASSLGIADRVHLLPPVGQRDLALILSGCDVVAMPSRTEAGWKEQFGRLLIEALACGTPVIGSSSGAIPEVIAATGGGLVIPEGDTVTLANAIEKLRLDPALRHALAQEGQRRVLKNYTLDSYVDRMGRWLESVMEDRGRASADIARPGTARN